MKRMGWVAACIAYWLIVVGTVSVLAAAVQRGWPDAARDFIVPVPSSGGAAAVVATAVLIGGIALAIWFTGLVLDGVRADRLERGRRGR